MEKPISLQQQKKTGVRRDHSISLITISGIEIRLDFSVIIIFVLIVYSLGALVFPGWHPGWSGLLNWSTAFASGILFFVSLLAHEMSHAIVAQKHNIPVPRITLFLFGGVAEISREPDTPKVEFLIAIAGPFMSILISIICSNLAFWLADDISLLDRVTVGDPALLTHLGPVPTMLLWLGSINMLLAVFNLIPGFPMDGGRIFRAMVWGLTGDIVKATRWASNIGRYFGWFLMAYGLVRIFSNGDFSGLWLILIGWFISNLAAMSFQQLITSRALNSFKVADLMRTRFQQIPGEMALTDFIDDYLLRSSQQIWPVSEGRRLAGFISLSDLSGLSPQRRKQATVAEVMRKGENVEFLESQAGADEAMGRLTGSDTPLPVIDDNKVVGLIGRGDVLKWISLHMDN